MRTGSAADKTGLNYTYVCLGMNGNHVLNHVSDGLTCDLSAPCLMGNEERLSLGTNKQMNVRGGKSETDQSAKSERKGGNEGES